MDITIANHLREMQLSTAQALLLHSDNNVLISYFKDMGKKLVYLQELTERDSKHDWIQIESFMYGLIKQDAELTNIEINLEIQPITFERKTARLTVKSY
jgi:hypothetical protein